MTTTRKMFHIFDASDNIVGTGFDHFEAMKKARMKLRGKNLRELSSGSYMYLGDSGYKEFGYAVMNIQEQNARGEWVTVERFDYKTGEKLELNSNEIFLAD